MRRLLALLCTGSLLVGACERGQIDLIDSTMPPDTTTTGVDRAGTPGSIADPLTLAGAAEQALFSANGPHVPTAGPWFEGWYTRITDAGGSRSLSVIAASHLPDGVEYQAGMRMPGYVAVLVSEGNGAATRSFEVFPAETYALVEGQPVSGDALSLPPREFEWVATGYGSITQNSIDLTIPGRVEVHARTGERVLWNDYLTDAGPEGMLVGLPLPLHWHVSSLGSPATYEYTLYEGDATEVRKGNGFAHMEKNWGTAFPVAWIWSQGIGGDDDAQFVLGGGDVRQGPVVVRAWIAAYRSPAIAMDFNYYTPGTVVETEFDGCAGTLAMVARSPLFSMTVAATADPASFGPVSIPTEDGFMQNSGGESFSATVTISAYLHDPLSGALGVGRLVEERVFQNAALEFGGDFACSDASVPAGGGGL